MRVKKKGVDLVISTEEITEGFFTLQENYPLLLNSPTLTLLFYALSLSAGIFAFVITAQSVSKEKVYYSQFFSDLKLANSSGFNCKITRPLKIELGGTFSNVGLSLDDLPIVSTSCGGSTVEWSAQRLLWNYAYYESYSQCIDSVFKILYQSCTNKSRSFNTYSYSPTNNFTYIYDTMYISSDFSSFFLYSMSGFGTDLNASVFGPCTSCSEGANMVANWTCSFFKVRTPYLCDKYVFKYPNWLNWIGIAFGNWTITILLSVSVITFIFRVVKTCILRKRSVIKSAP
jgi:hypothetical protein